MYKIETSIVSTTGINDGWNDTNHIPETTSPATASIAAPSQGTEASKTQNETQIKDPSTTARPVIVLVSVPERRRDVEKDRQKFATKDALLRHVQSNEGISVSNIDYVKTVHKGIGLVSETRIKIFVSLCLAFLTARSLTKRFCCRDRWHSGINADSVGHRSDRRCRDRLPWSDLTRGGYGPSHALQAIRDHSPRRLRRREDQGPKTRERERRKNVRDGER